MEDPISLFERAKKRKLVQWALAYAAAAWLLLQVLALLAQPFAWPDVVIRGAVVVLAVGFFAALIVAWFHGEKGHQKASGVELLMLGGLVIIAAGGVMLVSRTPAGTKQTNATAVASADETPSIAVLPFLNSSSVAENQYFADGITEEILTNLSKVSGLRVISRTSVMKYKDTQLSIPEIAQELNVTHVLEGRVQRIGDQLRIHAQLIRARPEAHIWAKQYDRGTADIFAVQSEIATAIASELKPRLSDSEGKKLATRPTDSFEAYDLYLKAREHYVFAEFAHSDTAARLLRRALETDPDFIAARALLARTFSLMSRGDLTYRDSAVATARQTVLQAPENADAHSALAETLREQGLYSDALKSYARALELEPNHPESVAEMGEVLGPYGLGRLDEAMPWIERAIMLDPATGWVYVLLGDSWRQLGDNERAKEAYARMQRVAPDYYNGITFQLRLAVAMKDTATVRTAIARIKAIRPDVSIPVIMSAYHAAAGDSAGAVAWTKQISDSVLNAQTALVRMNRHWYLGDRAAARREASAAEKVVRAPGRVGRAAAEDLSLALIDVVRGDNNAALSHIEQYYELGGRDAAQLRNHVMFRSLQGEGRMKAVIGRIEEDVRGQRRRVEGRRGL